MTGRPPNSPTVPAAPASESDDADDLEAGRRLFAGQVSFVKSVAGMADLPPADRAEVAFAGRSNVGKSSLINALFGRKTLARTSNTPGRTQLLNYFAVGDALYVVDMPGYGYAKASKTAIAAWTELIFDYLRGRASLNRVFLLIDARHGVKEADEQAMRELDGAAVSYQAVLTKIDKVRAADRDTVRDRAARALARHPAAHPHILATSARERTGLDELRAAIARFVPDM